MHFDLHSLLLLAEALQKLQNGFEDLPDAQPQEDLPRLRSVLEEVAERMQNNFPYFHPLYAGQMLKPPHPVARLAYMLSLWLNPNNHALDGGRASSAMEKEAVAELATMLGWSSHLGHLTSGGTMANLEGLWVAGRLSPGKTVVASDQAHYTHRRISEVLQLSFKSIPTDRSGRMDVSALRDVLGAGTIGTVVATIGTTGTGAVDPLVEILELQKRYGFRVHADAAYGGYYLLADNLRGDTRRSLQALAVVDSVAIDPHKHGLQPYGCGCILHRDPSVGRLYKHDSPYTYFTSSELHLGEISLECSRAGASAVALWATQKLLPLVHGGQFARDLGHCRQAALSLAAHIRQDERFILLTDPELDIVVWAPRAKSANEITERSRALFAETAKHHLHLALMTVPSSRFLEAEPTLDGDRDSVVCLRSCLMKPEHDDWIKSIWRILDRSMNEILGVASP